MTAKHALFVPHAWVPSQFFKSFNDCEPVSKLVEETRQQLKELRENQTQYADAILKSLKEEQNKSTIHAVADDLQRDITHAGVDEVKVADNLAIQCDITPAITCVDEVNVLLTTICTPSMFDNTEDHN